MGKQGKIIPDKWLLGISNLVSRDFLLCTGGSTTASTTSSSGLGRRPGLHKHDDGEASTKRTRGQASTQGPSLQPQTYFTWSDWDIDRVKHRDGIAFAGETVAKHRADDDSLMQAELSSFQTHPNPSMNFRVTTNHGILDSLLYAYCLARQPPSVPRQ
jgi:hypothetical protein